MEILQTSPGSASYWIVLLSGLYPAAIGVASPGKGARLDHHARRRVRPRPWNRRQQPPL